MAELRWRAGMTALALSAPKGWKAPEPSPAAPASTSSTVKLGAKAIPANVAAVQTSAKPVSRVP